MRRLPGDRFVSDTRTGDEPDHKKNYRITAAHRAAGIETFLVGETLVKVKEKPEADSWFFISPGGVEGFVDRSRAEEALKV